MFHIVMIQNIVDDKRYISNSSIKLYRPLVRVLNINMVFLKMHYCLEPTTGSGSQFVDIHLLSYRCQGCWPPFCFCNL